MRGSNQPDRHLDDALHLRHIRSPAHALSKTTRHIRHLRNFVPAVVCDDFLARLLLMRFELKPTELLSPSKRRSHRDHRIGNSYIHIGYGVAIKAFQG